MKTYEFIVAGGGVAGCAAALAAARQGMRTALIEKTVWPGGLATSGLVLVYLPIDDGHGRQEMFGLTEELLKASNKYGPVDYTEEWKDGSRRSQIHFSPSAFVLALDELLEQAGVDVWLDTLIIGAEKESRDGLLRSITVANKSGVMTLSAPIFVDATGDADVAAFAGEEMQLATNSLVTWVVEHREKEKSSAFNFGDELSTLIMSQPIDTAYTAAGIDGRMVTSFVLDGRRNYRKLLNAEYGKGVADRHSRYPMLLPTMVPLRHTRCPKGKFVLDSGMRQRIFEDCIGLASEWRGIGAAQPIPYRALLPLHTPNLLMGGRCISAINDAWELTRVIPAAALTGEVAGVASALANRRNVLPADLDYAALADELLKRNFRLK